MASVDAQIQGLISALAGPLAAARDYAGNAVPVTTASGMPEEDVLTKAIEGNTTTVAVVDRRITRNVTARERVLATTLVATAAAIDVSPGVASPSEAAVVTLSGSIASGDIAGVTIDTAYGATAVATAGDTLGAFAGRLATSISALPGVTSATAIDETIEITTAGSCAVTAAVANGGSRLIEVARRQRQFSIILWAPNQDAREAVGLIIEQELAKMEINRSPAYVSGVALEDGTFASVTMGDDFDLDDDVLESAFRHDFLLMVEASVTVLDVLFPVVSLPFTLGVV